MAHSHVRAPTSWQTDTSLIRLADLLDIPVVHAYGLVTALTGYLMDHYKSGKLADLSNTEIERAVEWTGKRGAFATAIVNDYADGRGVILRWSETAEPILKDREANLNRVNRFRQKLRETQDERVDDFVRQRSGENGRKSLSSREDPASQSAPPPPASPAPAQDATRVRAQKPADAADTPRPTQHGPPNGQPVQSDVHSNVDKPVGKPTLNSTLKPAPPGSSFEPPVMGDNGKLLPTADGSFGRYMAKHHPDSPLTELVMGDNMRDDTGDSHALQSPLQAPLQEALHRAASRAVVQDLEPEKGSEPEQRSVRTGSSGTATHPTERARVVEKMSILTSTILGLPVEGVAGIDDLEAMYGANARKAWDTIARFLSRFYETASDETIVGVLNEMVLVQTQEGIVSPSHARVAQVPGRALAAALENTIKRPPNRLASAWVYTLRALENGRANLQLGADDLTETERQSARNHRQDARIAPEVRRVMDGMTGPWRRKSVTTEADQKRTALRWMLSNDALKLELAELCERTFRTWKQDTPGLETAKDNWVKAEALKRWRAAGRPLPLPPR